MAKFTPGPVVARISGSSGGTVFSHNRGGMYFRNRSTPITSTTSFALEAKNRLAFFSQGWRSLSEANRLAWKQYASEKPIIDTLGDSRIMTAANAYIRLNSRLAAAGLAAITVPPIDAPPPPLVSVALTADIGAGSVSLAYTGTPLAAGNRLWLQAAVTDSPAIVYVKNLLRFIGVSSAAAASPMDIQALVEARLGSLVVGQTLNVWASVLDGTSGELSPPLRDSAVVVTT